MSAVISKIISGHQTGVDLGAIDAAISLGVKTGGFVPRGRLTEDGPLPSWYTNVDETVSDSYVERTKKNVAAADLTIVFFSGVKGSGTELTIRECEISKKEHYVYDLAKENFEFQDWLIERPKKIVINWAGSRESSSPGIQKQTYEIVREVIRRSRGRHRKV